MKYIIYFSIIYVILFIIDFYFLKNIKALKIDEFQYLKKKFNLKKRKNKHFKFISSIINAFIIFNVYALFILTNWPLLILIPIAFIMLLIEINIIYNFYGKYLKNKEVKK